MLDIEGIRDTIICGDCLEVMRQLPDNSIDLAVTSPPYNLKCPPPTIRWQSRPLARGYDNFNDKMPYNEYIEWQREVIRETLRILKDDGALYYNHKYNIRKCKIIDRREIFEGFPLRQKIIWQRSGGMTFNQSYFTPTYEIIYLIANKGYHIVKGAAKLTDIWRMDQSRNDPHPATFPVELPHRCIRSSLCMERDGAAVLDPFMGSGTTAVAALMLGKSFIGIDNSEKYCQMARDRVALAKFKKENEEADE